MQDTSWLWNKDICILNKYNTQYFLLTFSRLCWNPCFHYSFGTKLRNNLKMTVFALSCVMQQSYVCSSMKYHEEYCPEQFPFWQVKFLSTTALAVIIFNLIDIDVCSELLQGTKLQHNSNMSSSYVTPHTFYIITERERERDSGSSLCFAGLSSK